MAGMRRPLLDWAYRSSRNHCAQKALEMGLASDHGRIDRARQGVGALCSLHGADRNHTGRFCQYVEDSGNSDAKSLAAVSRNASSISGESLIPSVETRHRLDGHAESVRRSARLLCRMRLLRLAVSRGARSVLGTAGTSRKSVIKGIGSAFSIAGFVHAIKWVGAFVSSSVRRA
jgi:hypothetical protein